MTATITRRPQIGARVIVRAEGPGTVIGHSGDVTIVRTDDNYQWQCKLSDLRAE